jgi:hypothetical protein
MTRLRAKARVPAMASPDLPAPRLLMMAGMAIHIAPAMARRPLPPRHRRMPMGRAKAPLPAMVKMGMPTHRRPNETTRPHLMRLLTQA